MEARTRSTYAATAKHCRFQRSTEARFIIETHRDGRSRMSFTNVSPSKSKLIIFKCRIWSTYVWSCRCKYNILTSQGSDIHPANPYGAWQGKLQCRTKLLVFSVHGINVPIASHLQAFLVEECIARQYDLPVSKLMGPVIRDCLSLGNVMVDIFHCSSYHGPN